ncbi:MAG: pilus assembly protein TadG-related protein [Acidobacteria bacterium]|nr:pilus assembly protein TadG-related protein [Acidobacteriota bacterium]
MNPHDQRAQATILVLGMTMIVLGTVGLASDGTKAFLYRRTLQSAADAAALAGASELDPTRYYASKGRDVELDPAVAESAARRWLALRGLQTSASVQVGDNLVRVTLRGKVETLFLRIIGLRELPVAVEAASAPESIP